jgi:DNA-binding transcriptional regulator GbsR (MarR family)
MENKPVKTEEIVNELGMSVRSVRYGLKLLIKAKKITKIPDFGDLRSFYYVTIVKQ